MWRYSMELKSKFYDEFGYGFNFDDKPEIKHIGAALHVAVINEDELKFELDLKEFSFIPSDAEYAIYGKEAFRIKYINKVYNLIKPNQYSFFTFKKQETDDGYRDITVLFLKGNGILMAISPHLYPEKIDGKMCKIEEIFGKPASSVMVI